MSDLRNAGPSMSQEELRRIQRESEIEAEMEFAPHNLGDRVETDYVPALDEDDGILPDSEFFEPEETEPVPLIIPESKAEPAESVPIVIPEAVAPAADTAMKPAAAPDVSASSASVKEPVRKPSDSIDAMMTAQVPVEAVDGSDTKPSRQPQNAQKPRQAEPVPEEEPEEGPSGGDPGRTARIVLIIGIALILLAVLGFLIGMALMQKGNRDNSGRDDSAAISQQEESENDPGTSAVDASISGVILEMDETTGIVSVYSAVSKETQVFNLMKAELLTDAHGNSISYDALRVGDLVDVTYRSGAENKVRRLRLSSSETGFKDISGAVVDRNAGLIRINNKNYSYDSNLICQYQGEDINPGSITDRYVFNGAALDGHIYRITVTHAEGTVEIKGIEDTDENTKITFTPTVGKKVEVPVAKNMAPVALTEGFNHYVVERSGEILVSGSVFVNSGERTVLTLNSVGKQTGELEVQIRPEDADATITLDGKKQTKKLISDVEYGDHEIVVKADGYEEYKQTITLKQPYMPVTVNLKQTDVTVSVSASLKDTVVYCDGRYMGIYENKPVQFRLDPGSYELTLAHTGYEVLSYELQIESGSPAVDLYFSKFVPQVQYGQITLSIEPSDLAVRIVMDNVQQSSTTIANVEYGEHEIRVSADGYKDYTAKVKVDKENVPLSVKMEQSKGDVTVSIDPAGVKAKVMLDGQTSNNGEFKDVVYGEHTVEVSAEGYGTVKQNVTVDQNKVSVIVSLKKNTGNITVVTDPADAEVTLDGIVYGSGVFSDVDYGDHTLVITADGYITETKTVTVDKPEVSVNVTLKKSTATVKVTVKQNVDAVIMLDGKTASGGVFSEVEYGIHDLKVTADGYKEYTDTVTVDQAEVAVSVELEAAEESSKEESKEESSKEESKEESSKPEESSETEESSEAEESSGIEESSGAEESSVQESSVEESSEGTSSESEG
ncbi:MAG: PEGA domain-containing protein [Firmicutes bacterium]|nr:PEGA domain-containing protein [Bacillota bacterium]